MFTVTTQTYPNVTFSHYGALSEDFQYLFVNDELDERDDPDVSTTTTYVMDVSDPANPTYVTSFTNGLPAIDHNLRVRGNFLFEANYRSGLRVFDVSDVNNVQEVGYYDTYPADDGVAFDGAWGVYTDLPSGVVLVSDSESGLFILDATQATDTTPPTVTAVVRNGGGQNFDELVTLEWTFSEDVSASLGEDDLVLFNDSTAEPVDLTPIAEPTWDGGTNTATWTFAGAVIDRGFHTATLVAAGISDAAGNPLDGDGNGTGGDDFVATEVAGNPLLVAIPGDVDLDGAVTILIENPMFGGDPLPGDAVILNGNIGISSGALWADGDVDGDGAVTILIENPMFGGDPLPGDAVILNANIGMSVVVPVPDSAMATADFSSPSEPLITSAENVSPWHRPAQVYTPEHAARVFNAESTQPLRRPQRKASTRDVDLAIMDLSNERLNSRAHDRLAVDRHIRNLDSAWDDAIVVVVEDRQNR